MEMNRRLEYILEKAQSLDYKVEHEYGSEWVCRVGDTALILKEM